MSETSAVKRICVKCGKNIDPIGVVYWTPAGNFCANCDPQDNTTSAKAARVTDAQVRRAVRAYNASESDDIFVAMRLALESIAPDAEPVAWRWRYGDNWHYAAEKPVFGKSTMGSQPDDLQPLYAAPLPAKDAERASLIERLYGTEGHAKIIQGDEEQPLTVLLRDVRQYLERSAPAKDAVGEALLRDALLKCQDHVKLRHNANSWWNDPHVYQLVKDVIEPALAASSPPKDAHP